MTTETHMPVFANAMKKLLLSSLLLVAVASLVGCSTTHHQHAVEYKVITLHGKQGPPEPELNRLASEGWRASTAVALASRSAGRVSMAVSVAVMLSPSGRGAYWRKAGNVDGPTAYVDCRLSASPGVNAAVSTGGSTGLPALPRDGRGFSGRGAVGRPERSGGGDFGLRAMGLLMQRKRAPLKASQPLSKPGAPR